MRQAIKDHIRESQLFTARTLLGLFCVGVLVLVLIGRMAYLQIFSHEHFTTLSEKNRVRMLPEVPIRGLIYDREGRLLVENIPSFTLVLVPEQVDDLQATLKDLGELVSITEADLERFGKLLKRSRRFHPIPLRMRLNDEEVARIAVNRHRFPGVDVEARLLRHYPMGGIGVHALGYVGRINEQELAGLNEARYAGTEFIGKNGVEKAYEDVLHGEVGLKQVETNARGRILRVLERTPPIPGKNLYLSIDLDVQLIARQALGEENGAVVAIDPRSGQVLALVSMPEFDPNPFVTGIDVASYDELSKSPERPLFNRALQGRYPPGSTIKPLVALAALEYGVRGRNSSLFCSGSYTLPNVERKFRDWKREGHGTTDMSRAIIESCDVYFYDLARDLSIDRMHDFLSQFGFGRLTGIELAGEAAGLLPSSAWKKAARRERWYLGENLMASIGQGYHLSTPLQLAVSTATLAARGERLAPITAYKTEDPLTGAEHFYQKRIEQQVPKANARYWEEIIGDMEAVVSSPRGTAHRISRDLQYSIAGKTGTAQVFGMAQDEKYDAAKVAKKLRDHALFVGFAPVDDPQIAVAVIVENGGSGGGVAAPVARQVLDAYMLKQPK